MEIKEIMTILRFGRSRRNNIFAQKVSITGRHYSPR
jgi:hypothetical protein